METPKARRSCSSSVTVRSGRITALAVARTFPGSTEPPATCLGCGWCLLDLTRVKSGRACLPRQARQPRQPSRRAPIYDRRECDASLACRLAASSNRVGRSPTGGPLFRPSYQCRRGDGFADDPAALQTERNASHPNPINPSRRGVTRLHARHPRHGAYSPPPNWWT